ncbi:MAG: tetratricopeptide repeat protein [Candidatus Nitricoxidivorans perseverans]|uniref:Tetratricopeptide repeat protein n=1 Tax=Candidatus Nitricoxidivorans perseverans TaxID=2975601 RepID=A0AA49ITN9_9PROT|nr:MAG: tetratricopeptide repeat protein [Candidatus Nitricoxidivorans perseverans]
MSLINNMLRDLDSRHADTAEGSLPADVRPLPRPAGASRGPGTALLGLTFLVAVAAGAWWWLHSFEPPAPVVQQPSPAPASPAKPQVPPPVAMPEPPEPAPAAKPPAPKAAAAVPRDNKQRQHVPEVQGDTGLRLTTALAGAVPAEPAARSSVAAAADAALPTRIDKSPHLASARDRAENEYQKGFNLMRQGRAADAVGQFHAALREDPTHVPARNGLLNILVENHRLTEAEEVLRQGIGQPPVNLSWVVSLARLRIEQANTAGAWEVLQGHARIGAASSDFQGLAGVVLQKLGRMKEAGEHYQAATRIAPDNPRWWVGLGVAMEAEGRADAAREAYQRAKALPGLSPELAGFVEQRLR